jgi:LuxR family maltose regulon positive regulatory protein
MRRKDKPLIRINLLLLSEADTNLANPIEVGSQSWHDWLLNNQMFLYEGAAGHFSARRELRRGIGYWYAYRRRNGKLTKIYMGKSEELTQENLEQACAILAGQIPFKRLLGNTNPAALIPSLKPKTHDATSLSNETTEAPRLALSKVAPPVLPQPLIERPHLTQRINLPVTIICAPSGFGKSTVLNEWRQSCGMPVAWVSLDADDNDPLRFWLTVVTALRSINPNFGKSWFSALRSSSPSTLSDIVVNITNELFNVANGSNNSHWIGLVLDNYHHIQNTEIHTSIQILLDHMPSKLKLVISSHTKPPLALGFLRSKGIVAELGVDDLRFTSEEGIEYLKQHISGKQLSYSDIQTLVNSTKGWITGLVLATLALNQQEDRSRFIDTFTGAHPLLREFFMENVLSQLPSETQSFLIKTSILKHLTGPLCEVVTGQNDCSKLLANLWEERLFLERDEKPNYFCYDELFVEMLRLQLNEQYPQEIHRLHRKAAKWYCSTGAPQDAVDHLLACEEWEKAAGLIESVALSELEIRGEDSRLIRWLQQLPEFIFPNHKTLLAVYIRLSRISFSPVEADNFLIRIENHIESTPIAEQTDANKDTLAEIQRIRALWATNNPGITGITIKGAREENWQLLDGILQIFRDYRRDVKKAENRANGLYETAQEKHHLYTILMAGGGCANLALSQGHLRRSEQIALQILRQAFELQGKFPEPTSIALTALSQVYFMRNQLGQAHQLLLRAIEVAPNPASSNQLVLNAILSAKIQSAQGDNEAAFITIRSIREVHAQRPSSIWYDQDLIAYQELYRLRLGDLSSAEQLLSEAGEVEMNPFSALVRAEILMEQNRSLAAQDIIIRFLEKYPHGSYLLPVMRARVLLAIALFEQREINQARQVITEAARLAAPEFFIRPCFY